MEALFTHPWKRSNSVFQASSFSPTFCSNGWHLRSIVLSPSFRLQTPLHVPLCTITNKATGMLSNIFPLLAWGSMLSHKTKLNLKTGAHLIHSHRHYSCLGFYMIQTTSNSVIQDNSVQEFGTCPGVTTTSHLKTLNTEPIQDFHPSTHSQIFCSVHQILNPPSSINWKLHLCQPELHVCYTLI